MANKFATALRQRPAVQASRPAVGARGGSRRVRSKHIGGYFEPVVSTQLRTWRWKKIPPFSNFSKKPSICSLKIVANPRSPTFRSLESKRKLVLAAANHSGPRRQPAFDIR